VETDNPSTRVAANVRDLRQQRRMTVRDLSARMGELGRPLLPSGVTKIEQGQRRVDVDELVALAVALGVNPSRLLLSGTASDVPVALTPARPVPEWAAWQWADGFQPLPSRSADEGYNSDADREDFQLHSRPAEFRRDEQHPLMRAVHSLRFSAWRVVAQATRTDPTTQLIESTLSFVRRNLQRVASELDVIEEEAASRGQR
jgi:transcriptional regulator with XRE-family HTH domain